MIETIALFFGDVLSYIYSVVPNFGASILILTIVIKIITFPLNNKQIQSTKRMQKLQPEIKKIQQKYKDDKETQNKVMSEFMKENNMNPLSGCLPLLVQFPILIGIFRLLREPSIIEAKIGEAFSPFLFQSAEFINLLILPSQVFEDPATILTQVTVNFSSEGIYYLFPLIAGGTTYIYSKISMPAESSQKMMLYLMPGMITVFSFSFPIGLVLYWTFNNLFQLGQHRLINYLDMLKGNNEGEVVKVEGKTKTVEGKSENKKESKSDDKEKSKKKKKKAEDFFKDGLAKYEPNTAGKKTETKGESSSKQEILKDGKTKKKKKGKGKK
ncbi:MAG: YidC/Oxa1 family membrane protein insertase [Bacillota bacterium]